MTDDIERILAGAPPLAPRRYRKPQSGTMTLRLVEAVYRRGRATSYELAAEFGYPAERAQDAGACDCYAGTLAVAARAAAGLTQHQAAMLAGLRSQTRWAEYESGVRRPHPVLWELWLLRTGQHPTHMLIARPEAA